MNIKSGTTNRIENGQSTNDRRWAILQTIQSSQQVSVGELSQLFGVSDVSIRRDLTHLEELGLLQRVHGGAQATSRRGLTLPFDARIYQNTEVKRSIGQAAIKFIKTGNVIMLDAGTTVLEVAQSIPSAYKDDNNLTVVTRSLAIANVFRNHSHTRLIVLGGMYVHDFDTFVGPQVEHALQGIHVDTLFIGIDGISAQRGVTTDNVLEASLYPAMSRSADRIVVVSDSSKIGVNQLQATLTLNQFHTFITDDHAPDEFVKKLRDQGIEVILVSRGTNLF